MHFRIYVIYSIIGMKVLKKNTHDQWNWYTILKRDSFHVRESVKKYRLMYEFAKQATLKR